MTLRSAAVYHPARMETPPKILLVEDDPALALGLVDTLEFEGYAVVHASEGHAAVALALSEHPDCIILDLMLPDMNGYEVCTRVRRTDTAVPILMLTARSQEGDKVRGLGVGADDYVTKPFSVAELVARVKALLRRATRGISEQPMIIGGAEIDPIAQTMRGPSGEQEQLSFHEVELLKLLWSRHPQPVERDEILGRVWDASGSSTRTVDNVIVKLRKKLEPVPDKPRHILTVYGVGYKLVP